MTTSPVNSTKSRDSVWTRSPQKSAARVAKRISRHSSTTQRQRAALSRTMARSPCVEAVITQTIIQSPNQTSDTAITPCTQPPPLLLPLPDGLRGQEECVHSTINFTRSNFETGFWSFSSSMQWAMRDDTKAIGRQLNTWQKRMLTARRMLQMGHAAPAFQLLNLCLDKASELLKPNHPYGGIKIVIAVFERHESTPGLERAILRHLAQLTRIVLGAQHPLPIFLAVACEMDDKNQVIELHWKLRSIVTRMYLAKGFRGNGANLTFAVEDSSASTAPSEMMGGFLNESELRTCETMLKQVLQKDTENAMKVRTRLAYNLVLQERLDEADDIYDDLLTTLVQQENDSRREDADQISLDCHRGRLSIAMARGEREKALLAGFAMDNLCQAAFGRNSETRLEPLLKVESLLKLLGKEKDAKEVQKRWSGIWDTIYQKPLSWSGETYS